MINGKKTINHLMKMIYYSDARLLHNRGRFKIHLNSRKNQRLKDHDLLSMWYELYIFYHSKGGAKNSKPLEINSFRKIMRKSPSDSSLPQQFIIEYEKDSILDYHRVEASRKKTRLYNKNIGDLIETIYMTMVLNDYVFPKIGSAEKKKYIGVSDLSILKIAKDISRSEYTKKFCIQKTLSIYESVFELGFVGVISITGSNGEILFTKNINLPINAGQPKLSLELPILFDEYMVSNLDRKDKITNSLRNTVPHKYGDGETGLNRYSDFKLFKLISGFIGSRNIDEFVNLLGNVDMNNSQVGYITYNLIRNYLFSKVDLMKLLRLKFDRNVWNRQAKDNHVTMQYIPQIGVLGEKYTISLYEIICRIHEDFSPTKNVNRDLDNLTDLYQIKSKELGNEKFIEQYVGIPAEYLLGIIFTNNFYTQSTSFKNIKNSSAWDINDDSFQIYDAVMVH